MKLGTVLSALAATTLVASQPALAGTRSASSLPAAGVKVTSVDGRAGSRLAQSEDFVGLSVLPFVFLGLGLAFFATQVLGDDSFDDIDDLPDSP